MKRKQDQLTNKLKSIMNTVLFYLFWINVMLSIVFEAWKIGIMNEWFVKRHLYLVFFLNFRLCKYNIKNYL